MWILVMTLISSFDCVLAGMSYSARGIRIPFVSKFLIFITALVVGCISELASASLTKFIPSGLAEVLGQIILAIMGLFMLLTTLLDSKPRHKKKSDLVDTTPRTLFKLVLKSAGITIQVLKYPSEADIDQSGRIDPLESILLSVALTLDSVGLILCSALIGQNTILFPVALSIGQLAGLIIGGKLGMRFANKPSSSLAKYLPSLILILLAGIGLIR
jgi:putative sporulation protein YtaF